LTTQVTAAAPEALFYHLERQPLDRVLPTLVEKTVERGWRAVIQAGTVERVQVLDGLLWTYREEGFLPHGTSADGSPERQPVFLTVGDENPNGAVVRFLVDGAVTADYKSYQRLVFMFDGRDQQALAGARAQWKAAKAAGCSVTYWQQGDDGRWAKKA
jgi:DNA polymerase III subunit chi